MLDLKELEQIKPGDIIEWIEHFLGHAWVEEGEVRAIVCKAGFEKSEKHLGVHIHHYKEDYDTEVNYDDIIRVHKAED